MEFDKTRVYTAVNAEELPIGSRCIFADSIEELEYAVIKMQPAYKYTYTGKLQQIAERHCMFRFVSENNSDHNLAYLVDLAEDKDKYDKSKKYKPFSSIEKLAEAAKKHGYIIHTKTAEVDISLIGLSFCQRALTRINSKGLIFGLTLQELFDEHIFADDGTPCGELVEE